MRSCARLRSFLAARLPGEVSPDPSRPRTPADRRPATARLAAPPAALPPRTPLPANPPAIARIRGEGLEKQAFSLGRFFWGGAVTASSLRRSPFGLRRSARDPWRLPGTRSIRSLPGRLAAPRTPRHSPAAALARAYPDAAAVAASPHRPPPDPTTTTTPITPIRLSITQLIPILTLPAISIPWGGRHAPPRRASAPGYRRGDLADSPRYQTHRIAARSTLRRCFSPPRAGYVAASHAQPYSAGHRLGSHRAPGVQSPGLPVLVLPPGRGSPPCVRRCTVTGSRSAAASPASGVRAVCPDSRRLGVRPSVPHAPRRRPRSVLWQPVALLPGCPA